jgi:hypothetical protein
MAVSVGALVLGLGGTGYAAGFVRSGATRKTRKPTVVRGPRGPRGFIGYTGPRGRQGATGATGPQGPTGPAGGLNLGLGGDTGGTQVTRVDYQSTGTSDQIFNAEGLTLTASCASGGLVGLSAHSTDGAAELSWFGQNGGQPFGRHINGTGTGTVTILNDTADNAGSLYLSYGSSSGNAATAVLGFDYNDAFGAGVGTCGMWGTVTGLAPS